MSQIVETSQGSRHDDETRRTAAALYTTTGNMAKVAREMKSQGCKIGERTLQAWAKEGWFIDLCAELSAEKRNHFIARYNEIVERAQEITLDKLNDATAAQASLIACQAQDKSLLLQNIGNEPQAKAVQDMGRILGEIGANAIREYSRLREQREASTIDVTPNPGSTDS